MFERLTVAKFVSLMFFGEKCVLFRFQWKLSLFWWKNDVHVEKWKDVALFIFFGRGTFFFFFSFFMFFIFSCFSFFQFSIFPFFSNFSFFPFSFFSSIFLRFSCLFVFRIVFCYFSNLRSFLFFSFLSSFFSSFFSVVRADAKIGMKSSRSSYCTK